MDYLRPGDMLTVQDRWRAILAHRGEGESIRQIACGVGLLLHIADGLDGLCVWSPSYRMRSTTAVEFASATACGIYHLHQLWDANTDYGRSISI